MTDKNISNKVDQVADNAYVKLMSRLALPAMALISLQVWDGVKESGRDISTLVAGQMVFTAKMDDVNRRIDSIERIQNRMLFTQSETGRP